MDDAASSTADAFVERILSVADEETRRTLISHADLPAAAARAAGLLLVERANRLLNADAAGAARIARLALLLAEQHRDGYLRAMAEMRYGDAIVRQGRNAQARERFDRAALAFTRLGYAVEAARSRIGWVLATARLGRFDEAVAAARAARRVLVAHGETARVAALDQNTGLIFRSQGRYREALARFTAALEGYRALGDSARANVARCHANRGRALTALGRYREALAELELARDTYRQIGEHAGAARVLRSIGEHHMDLGRYAAALRAFDEAGAAFRTFGLSAERVWAAQDTADCYLRLGRPADALDALAGIEADLERTQSPQDALGVTARRVAALLALDRQEEALAVMDEAERRHPTGAVHHRAWLAAQRAALLQQAGAANEALATAERAHDLARVAGTRRVVADALLTRGAACLALGDSEEAAAAASRAQRLARAVDAAPLLSRAYELLGRVAEARGRDAAARRSYAEAIRQHEREQRGVIFEFRDSFAAGRGAAYERLALLQLRSGRPAEALATAERAKSRALADAVGGVVELRPRGSREARRLARALARARARYAAAGTERARAEREESLRDGGGKPVDALAEMETRITRLVQQLQLAGAGDDPADLFGAAPAAAMPALPDGTRLLEFFFCGDDLLRFRVDGARVGGDLIRSALPEIERLLRAFRANLDATERAAADGRERLAAHARGLLARLHERLLGGLDDLDRCRALVIVPHGLLHYLPFHALFDGERYLVERAPVSYAPSAALYGICRERAVRAAAGARPGVALVLAHSAGGSLPFALREGAAVAEALRTRARMEEAATRGRLRTAGRRAAVVHIAAHGRFRPDAPLFSAIELADGPLTTADIFDLDLRAALVTLSACETGRAVLGGGDELVGLTRAFLYAGATALLVSQWRVDDASTAALMTRFYGELAAGAGPAEALRRAQIAHIGEDVSQSRRTHPFYWAAFQVIGDDQGAPPRRARGARVQVL